MHVAAVYTEYVSARNELLKRILVKWGALSLIYSISVNTLGVLDYYLFKNQEIIARVKSHSFNSRMSRPKEHGSESHLLFVLKILQWNQWSDVHCESLAFFQNYVDISYVCLFFSQAPASLHQLSACWLPFHCIMYKNISKMYLVICSCVLFSTWRRTILFKWEQYPNW